MELSPSKKEGLFRSIILFWDKKVLDFSSLTKKIRTVILTQSGLHATGKSQFLEKLLESC